MNQKNEPKIGTRQFKRNRSRCVAGIALALILVVMHDNRATAQDDEAMRRINPKMASPVQIDQRAIDAAGIRRIESAHMVLYTDLNATNGIDHFPELFDQAVAQWCEQFDVPVAKTKPWRISAFLMRDGERFRKAGVLPDDLPNFPTGYNRGHYLWVWEQPGDYYTRHLFLHEGTHAFMQWFLGGSGPAWYSEGMAEKFGLNRVDENGKLTIGYHPLDRTECDHWERPAVIQKSNEKGTPVSLGEVLELNSMIFSDLDGYANSWAACEFLSNHPLSAKRFAQLAAHAEETSPDFGARLRRWLDDEWPALERDWALFIFEMEYGITSERSRLTDATTGPGENGAIQFQLVTDHSWQLTSIDIVAGKKYRFEPSGRFTVAEGKKPWPCESGGITIEYYRHRPLGMLMAGVLVPNEKGKPANAQVQAESAIGLGGEFEFDVSGRLVLRINENPARMDDNQGSLTVKIFEQ